MKRKLFCLLTAAVILLSAAAPVSAATVCTGGDCIQQSSMSAMEQQAADLINRYRNAAGVPSARISAELSGKARVKSKDMDTYNYFSHTSPTYGSPFAQMYIFGVSYGSAGENIAMGYYSAQEVVNAWMNSPSHKATMLSSRYNTMGIGYINGYWTLWLIS